MPFNWRTLFISQKKFIIELIPIILLDSYFSKNGDFSCLGFRKLLINSAFCFVLDSNSPGFYQKKSKCKNTPEKKNLEKVDNQKMQLINDKKVISKQLVKLKLLPHSGPPLEFQVCLKSCNFASWTTYWYYNHWNTQ